MSAIISSNLNSLRSACEKGDVLELERCLLHHHEGDISLVSGDRYGNTLLHLAIAAKSTECVKLLLKRNMNVDAKNMDMNTSLHFAAKAKSVECVRILLEAGAKLTEKNRSLNTPLHIAAETGSSEIIKLLVDKMSSQNTYVPEAEVNVPNEDARTPLHLAAQSGSVDCVEILVNTHASPSLNDVKGNTPLHYAAMSGSPYCVKYLIENGADLICVNKAKYSPLSLILNNMPNGENLLKEIMNESVEVMRLENGKEELKVNLKVMCPKSKNKMAIANRLYTTYRHRTPLLLHPLPKMLVSLEWEKSKYVIWYRFSVYLLYLILLSIYASSTTQNILSMYLRVSVGILSIHVTLFCIPYILPAQYSCFRRFSKTTITIIPPLLALIAVCITYNPEWCGISFLLSWLSVPFYSSAISYISHQAGMFIYVTKEIFKHSLILVFVLLGFALTFYILYYERDSENFDNFWHAFLYTIFVLLEGDNLGDFPNNGGNSTANATIHDGYFSYVTQALSNLRFASIIASILFVMVVIIALLNMLVALAVRSGDELMDYGQVYHLWSQAQLLYEWNETKRFLKRLFPIKATQSYEHFHGKDCIIVGDQDIPLSLRHELSAAARYRDKHPEKMFLDNFVEDKLSDLITEMRELKAKLKTAMESNIVVVPSVT